MEKKEVGDIDTDYKLKICKICLKLKKCRMLKCDRCYAKTRPTKICSNCLVYKIIVSYGICHSCNEKRRRLEKNKAAKTDIRLQTQIKENNKEKYIKSKKAGCYSSLKRRVAGMIQKIKQRFKDTDIDREWYLSHVVNKECHYCGISEIDAKKVTKNNLHIDRKIPELGYTQNNCVPACKACNTAKLNFWNEEETKQLGSLIFSFYQRRLNER